MRCGMRASRPFGAVGELRFLENSSETRQHTTGHVGGDPAGNLGSRICRVPQRGREHIERARERSTKEQRDFEDGIDRVDVLDGMVLKDSPRSPTADVGRTEPRDCSILTPMGRDDSRSLSGRLLEVTDIRDGELRPRVEDHDHPGFDVSDRIRDHVRPDDPPTVTAKRESGNDPASKWAPTH